VEPLLKGVGFGLILSVAMGPVFLELIRLSLMLRYRRVIAFSLGIMLSDLALGLLFLSITGPWMKAMTSAWWLRLAGGGVFIALGLGKLWQHRKMPDPTIPLEQIAPSSSPWRLFIKGVSLNVFNPFVMAFWLATSSLARLQYGYDFSTGSIFIVSIVGTVFLTDNLKILGARRIRHLMKTHWLVWLSRITGLIFILAGIQILLAKSIE